MRIVRSTFPTVIRLAVAVCFLPPGHAAAPPVKTQSPGFYRMMLGDFEVTALNDGVVAWPTATALPSATPEQITNCLSEMGLSDPVGMSYNALLINTGSKLVLIDTGTGGKLDDSPGFHGAGRLLANLRAAGYQPEQVDEIYITHVGPDHVGGLTHGTERTFPNAILRAAKSEVDGFLNSDKAAAQIAAAPDTVRAQAKAWLQFLAGLFAPYIKAGKFESFDEDLELVPGIRALATHGHTPGHTSYVVESRGQTLIVLGDLVHVGAVQFAYPSLPTSFDADPDAAIVQRKRAFQLAADKDYWVAGAHLSFPGIGHVRAEQGHYRWIPVN